VAAVEEPRPKGLSKEAWAAIGGIGAALITGSVTLAVYLIPPAKSDSSSPRGAVIDTLPGQFGSSTATGAPAVSAGAGSPIAALVGNWRGTAQAGNDPEYEITLTVTKACTVGRRCGSISVSSVPCYGQISLVAENGGDIEFSVDHFDQRSDQRACQSGAGEHFRLRADGKLDYHTDYSPVAHGTLSRG
jgi:hypothetical protein